MQIRRVLALSIAMAFLATGTGSSVLAQRNNQQQQQQPKRSKAEQADIDALVLATNASALLDQTPTDVVAKWDMNHFMRAPDGNTVFPFVITVDKSTLPNKDAAIYIRLMEKSALESAKAAAAAAAAATEKKDAKDQQVTVPSVWENIYFIDVPNDGKISRAVAVAPGEYEVFIALKEKAKDEKSKTPPKVGVLRHSITVPDFNSGLMLSQVITASAIEEMSKPLGAKEALEQPYVFGPLKIVPTLDPKFAKTAEFNVVFWVYGAGTGSDGKPSVQIDYNFHQKTGDTEKFFNRTEPQKMDATTLPAEFDFAKGHQLTGIQSIPLASFPAGDYRLEIKVTDKAAGGKTVTQNVNFTVTGA